MKILIAGASGFLGSHVVEQALERGHEPHVILRKTSSTAFLDTLGSRVTRHIGDLTDRSAVLSATQGMDRIIHAAGRVTDRGSYGDFYRDNVLATEHLLDSAKENGVSEFIFISSPSIFSADEDHIDFDETAPYPSRFINFYAKTKALAESRVMDATTKDFYTVSLRPRGIWGARDSNGFMPKLLRALRQGKLRDFSGGRKVRASLCHARNAADACFDAPNHREATRGQAYFIADDEEIFVWDLIAEVGQKLGLPATGPAMNPRILNIVLTIIDSFWKLPWLHRHLSPPISRYGLGMLSNHTVYSIQKAKRDFGYAPKYSISRDLNDFLDWIEKTGGLDHYLRI